jgi:hypothetical protein
MAYGKKTGGRQKGSKNKHKLVAEIKADVVVRAVQAGETPLEYMLRIMRSKGQPNKRRDEMARAAAPYVHSKVTDGKPLGGEGGLSLEDLIHLSYQAGKKAKPEEPTK